jgi:hypothetical protein
MSKLYHFTWLRHWESIKESGYIDVTESNISGTKERHGPDIVWLTKDPDWNIQPWQGQAIEVSPGFQRPVVPKDEVRLEVNAPDALPWIPWAKKQGAKTSWLRTLAKSSKTGKGTEWYVCPVVIPLEAILSIDFNPRLEEHNE